MTQAFRSEQLNVLAAMQAGNPGKSSSSLEKRVYSYVDQMNARLSVITSVEYRASLAQLS